MPFELVKNPSRGEIIHVFFNAIWIIIYSDSISKKDELNCIDNKKYLILLDVNCTKTSSQINRARRALGSFFNLFSSLKKKTLQKDENGKPKIWLE